MKSTLRILPRHNGIVPIKIKGYTIKGHTAYFISDQDFKRGRTPRYTSLMEFITSKEKHMLMLFSNYTNKDIPFNKGEYLGTSGTIYRRHAMDPRRFRITNSSQYHHKKDNGQES